MKAKAIEREKSVVLGDIKNLIKDYKNEKKMNQSMSKQQLHWLKYLKLKFTLDSPNLLK